MRGKFHSCLNKNQTMGIGITLLLFYYRWVNCRVSCSSSVPFDSHALDPHNAIERARTDQCGHRIFLYNNKSQTVEMRHFFFFFLATASFSLCRYNTERRNDSRTSCVTDIRFRQPSSTLSACQFSIRFL